jgi:hypothetical protein
MDLGLYRERAESFIGDLDREHYLHFSGQKPDFEIEAIYDRYPGLFEREAVERLREVVDGAAQGDERRRAEYLFGFAVDGHLGQATKAEEARIAEREAALEVSINGDRIPYRQAPVIQANEPDPDRRAALEEARLERLEADLNPLHRAALERAHELSRELGWASYRDMYAELRGIDLEELARQTAAFVAATDPVYAELLDPELERTTGLRLGELRRSDLPRFFRAVDLDARFPEDRLVDSLVETMAGLGIEVESQPNVILDVEDRPQKTPRAFCCPVEVPDEVYLVVPRVGGRDDFGALFHEAGHTEHYANVDSGLSFEFRYLGDNSVTESFAFLVQGLTEDATWLERVLGVDDPAPVVAHARASRLVYLRRYSAKIAYELELHDVDADLGEMPGRYSSHLGDALRVPWPETSWLADVDGGFYAASYLRAWALETFWRKALREEFGDAWFERPEAGDWLKRLWREGQRLPADELLAETLGEKLDFAVLVPEFA